jgi:hypothetical protein
LNSLGILKKRKLVERQEGLNSLGIVKKMKLVETQESAPDLSCSSVSALQDPSCNKREGDVLPPESVATRPKRLRAHAPKRKKNSQSRKKVAFTPYPHPNIHPDDIVQVQPGCLDMLDEQFIGTMIPDCNFWNNIWQEEENEIPHLDEVVVAVEVRLLLTSSLSGPLNCSY